MSPGEASLPSRMAITSACASSRVPPSRPAPGGARSGAGPLDPRGAASEAALLSFAARSTS
eukprot:8951999-Pyramimonas_sp.AAC.1